MNFSDLIDALNTDTRHSLNAFRPELALCGTIVVMLLVRVFSLGQRIPTALIAMIGAAIGLWYALPSHQPFAVSREEIFTGLLVYDNFTVFFRALLLLFVVLFIVLTQLSGIPDREDAADFYCLVFGATLGMCIMASANHLLMIFLGVEMASVPSYALAGMLKGRPQSSEAALKYAIFGAGTAGVMLYGISLLAGVLGSVHLPTMAHVLSDKLINNPEGLGSTAMILALGGLMVAVGLAFKLSAVPFHFWCPDVFEGASAEVDAFLSVASKAAALALLVRVTLGFGTLPPTPVSSAPVTTGMYSVADDPGTKPVPASAVAESGATKASLAAPAPATTSPVGNPPVAVSINSWQQRMDWLGDVRRFAALIVALLAAITCTFGNLAAYGQTNIKRLLAYSTIAHAGYMMMPVAAAMFLAGPKPEQAEAALSAIPFYASVYLFMNLGAFAIVALMRNVLRSEQIADYAGLIRRCPGLVICFGVILFSLIGLPPLAGFSAKWTIFAALIQAMDVPLARDAMIVLVVVAGLNTAISLFYYLRVVKVMAMDPEPENRLPLSFSLLTMRGAYIVAITAPVLILGVWWNELYHFAHVATQHLLTP